MLPQIVRFLPPTYAPGSSCPHCGATGARIHHFETADGAMRGAMSGCVKLFPIAPVALVDLKLSEKEAKNAKNGFKMASWDVEKRQALDAFYAGTADEQSTLATIRMLDNRAKNWRTRRGYGR